MNTDELNKLSAKYIFEQEERLLMALHVYEAMPIVREYVIKDLFERVGSRVANAVSVVKQEYRNDAVYFRTEESGDLYIYAWLYDHEYFDKRSRSVLSLVAGIYGKAESTKAKEIGERLETRVRLKTWSYGRKWSSKDKLDPGIAFTFKHHEHGTEWPYTAFLRRVIDAKEEVVSEISELLVDIYKGVFPLTSS